MEFIERICHLTNGTSQADGMAANVQPSKCGPRLFASFAQSKTLIFEGRNAALVYFMQREYHEEGIAFGTFKAICSNFTIVFLDDCKNNVL